MSAAGDPPGHRSSSGSDTRAGPEHRGAGASISYRAAKDCELVDAILAGDRVAFAELVRRYQGPLLRLVMVFVRDRAVAEEAVQDAWLGALDGLALFARRASLKAWLFRIATNVAKTRCEREARSVPFSALAEVGEEAAGADPARFDKAGMWQEPPHVWGPQRAEEMVRRAEAVGVMEAAVASLSVKT